MDTHLWGTDGTRGRDVGRRVIRRRSGALWADRCRRGGDQPAFPPSPRWLPSPPFPGRSLTRACAGGRAHLVRYEEAFKEKQRLEHKQRAARKLQEEGTQPKPRWFELATPDARSGYKDKVYVSNGEYFEARDKGQFTGCRDIFGQDVVGEPPKSA